MYLNIWEKHWQLEIIGFRKKKWCVSHDQTAGNPLKKIVNWTHTEVLFGHNLLTTF